jgi:hypothetical protein
LHFGCKHTQLFGTNQNFRQLFAILSLFVFPHPSSIFRLPSDLYGFSVKTLNAFSHSPYAFRPNPLGVMTRRPWSSHRSIVMEQRTQRGLPTGSPWWDTQRT